MDDEEEIWLQSIAFGLALALLVACLTGGCRVEYRVTIQSTGEARR